MDNLGRIIIETFAAFHSVKLVLYSTTEHLK